MTESLEHRAEELANEALAQHWGDSNYPVGPGVPDSFRKNVGYAKDLAAIVLQLLSENRQVRAENDSLHRTVENMETHHVTWKGPDGKEYHPDWCRECRVTTLEQRLDFVNGQNNDLRRFKELGESTIVQLRAEKERITQARDMVADERGAWQARAEREIQRTEELNVDNEQLRQQIHVGDAAETALAELRRTIASHENTHLEQSSTIASLRQDLQSAEEDTRFLANLHGYKRPSGCGHEWGYWTRPPVGPPLCVLCRDEECAAFTRKVRAELGQDLDRISAELDAMSKRGERIESKREAYREFIERVAKQTNAFTFQDIQEARRILAENDR